MNAPLNQRQIAILNRIRRDGRVMVDDLADGFNATPQTIRRDLQILADTGEVMRFHGGASLPAGVEYTGFDVRSGIAAGAKEDIGRAVAARIPNNVLLMINGGTTTANVARELKSHGGIKVIVDNVAIADVLRTYPGVDVTIPGGNLRRSDGAVLGQSAVEFIGQFRADIAVIGAAAIDSEGNLFDFDMDEVHVTRAIIENARHVILAVDSMKFGRNAPVRITGLSQIHAIVTDRCTDGDLSALCRERDIELVETTKTG